MALSKEAYLKKYLSQKTDSIGKKKKGKSSRHSKFSAGLKIFDEDFDSLPTLSTIGSTSESSKKARKQGSVASARKFEVESEEEADPVVVLVGNKIDELQMIEKFKTTNWKSLEASDTQRTKSTRHDSESDQSIGARSTGSRDQSPVRRRQLSPSIKRRRNDSASPDISKKFKQRQASEDSDLSPKRGGVNKKLSSKSSRRHPTLDPRTRRRSPASPHSSKADSVHATTYEGTDLSPKRGRVKTELPDWSSSDATNKASSRHDTDLSPRRGGVRKEAVAVSRRGLVAERHENGGDSTVPIKRQDQYDKHRRSNKKKPRELTEEEKQRVEEMKKKYDVWNKGTKQVQDRVEKLKEMAETIEKPLARYRDDADLDDHLKDQLLDADPMLAYMRAKRPISSVASNKSDKPKYRGQAPANRYGILPGYRWDGVDRSNGFEAKLLSQANVKKAEQDEYYAWSSGRFE